MKITPHNTPEHFYNCKSNAYVILCYARMMSRWRGREWFTNADYIEFQDNRIGSNTIRNITRRLYQNGLLQADRTNPNATKYRITDAGLVAINRIERKHHIHRPDKDTKQKLGTISVPAVIK